MAETRKYLVTIASNKEFPAEDEKRSYILIVDINRLGEFEQWLDLLIEDIESASDHTTTVSYLPLIMNIKFGKKDIFYDTIQSAKKMLNISDEQFDISNAEFGQLDPILSKIYDNLYNDAKHILQKSTTSVNP